MSIINITITEGKAEEAKAKLASLPDGHPEKINAAKAWADMDARLKSENATIHITGLEIPS